MQVKPTVVQQAAWRIIGTAKCNGPCISLVEQVNEDSRHLPPAELPFSLGTKPSWRKADAGHKRQDTDTSHNQDSGGWPSHILAPYPDYGNCPTPFSLLLAACF